MLDLVIVCSMGLAEFRHNRITQSPHENYFNVGNTKKVRSLEDVKLDNQLWGVKRTLSYFLLVATYKTIPIRPPQGLLFLFVKIL